MAVARSFYAVDGVWNENTGNMTQESVIPNPDSLEEVRVLQNNFSAQYSLMGSSVILMQTKSGTSDLHGTVWEFLRNDDLNARPYYSTTIPPYKQNIFWFNVGGPLFIPKVYNTNRQKTFFFWDEAYVVLHVPNLVTSQLPSPNQIAGCFVSPVKDPLTGNLFPTVSTCNGTAGTFYQIPTGRINTSSSAYLQTLYPAPDYSPTGSTLNYINNKPQTTYQRDDQIKVDHYITQNYHLLAEYFQEYQNYAQNNVSSGTTPISSETDFTNNKLATVSLTQTLTPNMVNTTNIAMNIFLLNLTVVGKTDISQIPGFAETLFYPNANYSTRTPVISLAGGLAAQGINGRPIPHASDLDDTVSDNWSWLKGKNYLTAGVTFVWNTKRQQSIFATNGSFTFSGASSGPTAAQKTTAGACNTGNSITATACTQDDGVADMLLGYISAFSQYSFEPHGDIHDFSWSPYAEDRFQFNKNLTFTLGLQSGAGADSDRVQRRHTQHPDRHYLQQRPAVQQCRSERPAGELLQQPHLVLRAGCGLCVGRVRRRQDQSAGRVWRELHAHLHQPGLLVQLRCESSGVHQRSAVEPGTAFHVELERCGGGRQCGCHDERRNSDCDGPEHPGLAGGQLVGGSAARIPDELHCRRCWSGEPNPAPGGHMEPESADAIHLGWRDL